MSIFIKRSLTTLSTKYSTVDLNKISLTGRDFIIPVNLICSEIKSLLWTAIDLKKCYKQKYDKNVNLNNARVSVIVTKPTLTTKFSLSNAAQLVNAHVNTIVDDPDNFCDDYEELGKVLNCYSDIIFTEIDSQKHVQKIADGASTPVINIKSYKFSLIKVLADLMTIQEHYNYLKCLKFGLVGVHGPLINTYMCILPRLGININYFCVDHTLHHVSPCLLRKGLESCKETMAEIHECSSVEKTIYRCDVICTNHHKHENLKITKDFMKEAAIKWTYFEPFPKGREVEEAIFKHKNNLTIKSLKNMQWIYAAILIRFLKNYNHITNEPPFDDFEAAYKKE